MVKHLTRLIGYGIVLLVLAAAGLALWLHLGVREAGWVKPRLERALNPEGVPYRITIGDVVLDWRKPGSFGEIVVQSMTVRLLDQTLVASVPQVKVTIDPLGFLPGRRGIDQLIVTKPRLYLSRTQEGSIRLGLDTEGGQALPVQDFLSAFEADTSDNRRSGFRLPFRGIFIHDAVLTMREDTGVRSFATGPIDFTMGRSFEGRWQGLLRMPFSYLGKGGRMDATLSRSITSLGHTLDIGLIQVPLELLCQLGACPANVHSTGYATGRATIGLSRNNVIKSGQVTLKIDEATIAAPEAFEEPLTLKQGSFIAAIGKRAQNIAISNLQLVMADTTLSGNIKFFRKPNDWQLIAEGSASALDMRKLYKYWPIFLAKESRASVTNFVKSGYAEHAQVRLNITKAMHDANKFPDEAVWSQAVARDLTIEYLPGFPLLENANGTVYFIGNGMRAELEHATLLSGTKVTKSVLVADDLHHPKAPMVATLRLSAPAADVVKFLELKHFTFDEGWKLNAATISGNMDATMKIGFDSFSDDPSRVGFQTDNIEYDLGATLTNISQPGVMGSKDIKGLSGRLNVANDALNFDGKLALSPAATLNVKLEQDDKGVVAAQLSGQIPRTEFAALGIPDRKEFGEGNLGLNAAVDLGKDTARIHKLNLDLKDIALSIPAISWNKPRGQEGTLSVLPLSQTNQFSINLKVADLAIDQGTLTLANQSVTALNLPRVVSASNDFGFEYRTTPEGFTVALTGKQLDASASYGQSENSILADFPPITLNLNLGQLSLTKATPLKNISGSLACDRVRCNAANIIATAGESTIKATISKPGTRRQLLITASNAGDFLRALDITDRLYKGRFELRGLYNDTKENAPFGGRVMITNFNLKNSEILARILSIASISGLSNALTGSGIDFEKLSANISHEKGVVRVSKGLASGASLGITLEGTVDTNTTKLDMKGTFAPAYLLNSIFGKIPIIKEIVGKEEGLIAFSYNVGGTYAKPDVSVNPLSGLTPGFLRGIFTSGKNDDEVYPGEPEPPRAVTKKPSNAP